MIQNYLSVVSFNAIKPRKLFRSRQLFLLLDTLARLLPCFPELNCGFILPAPLFLDPVPFSFSGRQLHLPDRSTSLRCAWMEWLLAHTSLPLRLRVIAQTFTLKRLQLAARRLLMAVLALIHYQVVVRSQVRIRG